MRFYQEAFGFAQIFSEYIEVGEQGMESQVVQSPSGGVTFTLIQPDMSRARRGRSTTSSPGTAGRACSTWRSAPTTSCARCARSATAASASRQPPASYYDVAGGAARRRSTCRSRGCAQLGMLVDRDHWGQLFQIFTQSLHVRRTFFLELIERHGARTFGTSNIPALYEAKERELAAASARRPRRTLTGLTTVPKEAP